jgi:hypothetical protein
LEPINPKTGEFEMTSKFKQILDAAAKNGIVPEMGVAAPKKPGKQPMSLEEIKSRYDDDPKSISYVLKKRLLDAGMIERKEPGRTAKPTEEIFKDAVLNGFENLSIAYRQRLVNEGLIVHVPAHWDVTDEYKKKAATIKMQAANKAKREAAQAAKNGNGKADTDQEAEAA